MAGGHPRERTALIVTVLNEAATIEALLESVASQTRRPDEVVVADGGSVDGTFEALQRWSSRVPLRVVQAPGANIARGRNVAIQSASSELIAVTDAGVRLEPDWLEQLQAGLTDDVHVVSGFFRPDPRSPFEHALGATTLPAVEDVNPESFLPSSRSALFRRHAWEQVGGYPEWLDYGEDLVFDLRLKRAGCRFTFVPKAIAWFRPRHSPGAFFRQYYLYARGDGKAGLWWRRHAIRYAAYAAAATVLWRRSRAAWLLPLGVAAYTWRPYARLELDRLTPAEALCVLSLPPAIRLVGDVAKMLGYPVGVWWRWRRAWTSRSSS
jgi:glycosyltransferase involved in cell wall biosynthesis